MVTLHMHECSRPTCYSCWYYAKCFLAAKKLLVRAKLQLEQRQDERLTLVIFERKIRSTKRSVIYYMLRVMRSVSCNN